MDAGNFDLPRLGRLPGTWNRKGPDDPEGGRPHRLCRIVSAPDDLEDVAPELIAAVCSELDPENVLPATVQNSPDATEKATYTGPEDASGKAVRDVLAELRTHGVGIHDSCEDWTDLDQCPKCGCGPATTGERAPRIFHTSKGLGYHCLHTATVRPEPAWSLNPDAEPSVCGAAWGWDELRACCCGPKPKQRGLSPDWEAKVAASVTTAPSGTQTAPTSTDPAPTPTVNSQLAPTSTRNPSTAATSTATTSTAKAAEPYRGEPDDDDEDDRLRVYSLAELATLPRLRWLVDGLLPAGSLCTLTASSGVGKTFAALDVALSIATDAGEVWGKEVKTPGSVAYVSTEGNAGMFQRVNAWATHHGRQLPPAGRFAMLLEGVTPTEDDQAERLVRNILGALDEPPKLLVLDTLARCFGGEESSNSDMMAFVRSCDRIGKALGGCSVLVLHHTGWGGSEGSGGNRERGAKAIRDAADMAVYLDHTDGKRAVRVTCSKAKDAEPFEPFELRPEVVPLGADPETGDPVSSLVLTTGDTAGMKFRLLTAARKDALCSIVRQADGQTFTRADALRWGGLSNGATSKALDAFVSAGLLVEEGEGRAKRYALHPGRAKMLEGEALVRVGCGAPHDDPDTPPDPTPDHPLPAANKGLESAPKPRGTNAPKTPPSYPTVSEGTYPTYPEGSETGVQLSPCNRSGSGDTYPDVPRSYPDGEAMGVDVVPLVPPPFKGGIGVRLEELDKGEKPGGAADRRNESARPAPSPHPKPRRLIGCGVTVPTADGRNGRTVGTSGGYGSSGVRWSPPSPVDPTMFPSPTVPHHRPPDAPPVAALPAALPADDLDDPARVRRWIVCRIEDVAEPVPLVCCLGNFETAGRVCGEVANVR